MIRILPVYKHPTTIIALDDDRFFLDSVVGEIPTFNVIKKFTDYKEALKVIEQSVEGKNTFQDKYVKSLNDSKVNEIELLIKYSTIYKEYDAVEKYNNVATLIVDYNMPEINGLEFAKLIKARTNIFIVLLTGEANEQTVIDAFNNGVIDAYISKVDAHLLEKLNDVIKKSEESFFGKLSSFLSQAILMDSHSKQSSCYLGNLQYIKFFLKYVEENNIKEFYLIDRLGSYLLKDKDNNLSIINIADEKRFKLMLEILPDDTNKDSLRAIKEWQQMLCLPDYYCVTDISVNDYIKDCYRISGANKLYYSSLSAELLLNL